MEGKLALVNLAAHVNPTWAVLRAQLAGAVGVVFVSQREDGEVLIGDEGMQDEPPHELQETISIPSIVVG